MTRHTLRLTERDHEVLDALGEHRFLSAPQLAALFFPSVSAVTSRMRQLVKAKVAQAVFLPVRPFDRMSTTIWALTPPGARLVRAAREGAKPSFLATRDGRSALFLDHTLRRNDLRVALTVLDRHRARFDLLRWRQAPDEVRGIARVRASGSARHVAMVPDGFFALRYQGEEQAFVVEIDMGTVSVRSMAIRYRAYWKWWKTGGMRRRFGDLPIRVLTLATTPARIERLRQVARLAPEGGKPGTGLFWFAPLDAADLQNPERLLDPVWTVARTRGPAPQKLFLT